jgi:site-specific recombinase XerC
MDNNLLAVLGRLSPSNQRLIRELVWKLAQLEQLAAPELFDSTLNHQQQFHNWLTHLISAGTAPGTILHYRHAVLSLLESAPKPTRAHIEAYIAGLTVKGLAPGTIAFQVSAISSYFRFLADSDIIIVNPTARIRRPRQQRQLRKPPSEQQVLALMSYPKAHRFQTILLLFIDSGLRLSEAASLRIDSLPGPLKIISVLGKGNKPRQVPISSITAEAITAQLQHLQTAGYIGHWLFPSPDPSNHIGARSVDRYFDRLSAKLGFKVTPHQLRHYFAT